MKGKNKERKKTSNAKLGTNFRGKHSRFTSLVYPEGYGGFYCINISYEDKLITLSHSNCELICCVCFRRATATTKHEDNTRVRFLMELATHFTVYSRDNNAGNLVQVSTTQTVQAEANDV